MTIYEYIESIKEQPACLGGVLRFEGTNDQVQVLDGANKRITLAADARCKLLVVHRTAQNVSMEVELGERAVLTMAVLYPEDGVGAEGKVQVVQQEASRLQMTALQLASSTLQVEVDLVARDAESVVNALFAIGAEEQSRLSIRTNHRSSDCRSSSVVRGLAGGKAVGAFDGMVYVAPDAQRTDAFQQNRNMLLSETARIDTKPQLEIYADDVKCSHGATVGQMDNEAIYYMRQRGLDEQQARRLQLTGFADDLVMRCGCEQLCELLMEELNHKLDRI